MYSLIALFYCLALGVSDPEPNQPARASWPWLDKSGQSATSSNWPSSDSAWPNNGGGDDPRGDGWDSYPISSNWGLSNWGSSGNNGWGLKRCGGNIRRFRYVPSIFDIERQLIGAAEKIMGFCNAYSDRPLREVYGVEHFKLRVRLLEFTEDDIQVRVRQRLVTVMASNCAAEYAAVRILPDVVDARQAIWKMDGQTLTVLFPYYINPDTEIESCCGRGFHGDPIIVPKCAPGTQFVRDYDTSFSDAKLREVLRRVMQELN